VRAIRALLGELGFPVLGSLVDAGDVDALVEHAMGDFFITQSPHPWSEAEVRAAFDGALRLSAR
jgi:alcohol dehydrogenase